MKKTRSVYEENVFLYSSLKSTQLRTHFIMSYKRISKIGWVTAWYFAVSLEGKNGLTQWNGPTSNSIYLVLAPSPKTQIYCPGFGVDSEESGMFNLDKNWDLCTDTWGILEYLEYLGILEYMEMLKVVWKVNDRTGVRGHIPYTFIHWVVSVLFFFIYVTVKHLPYAS